jgi:3'(2'), 5'-bisphosphate nucleotidase
MTLQDQQELAKQAARLGGQVLMDFRAQDLPLQDRRKLDGSMVTAADAAASLTIREALLTSDPRGFILDEEELVGHEIHRPRDLWIVDPLDGTRFFVEGTYDFCTLVGYVSDGMPMAGAMHFPQSNTTYWGGGDCGAWMQVGEQTPIQLHGRRLGSLSTVRMGGPWTPRARHIYERVGQRLGVKENRIVEPAGEMYAALVRGDIDLVVSQPGKPSVWDVAAGHAILRAIGGIVVDLSGRPIDYQNHTSLKNGSIATIDPTLLPEILTALPPQDELVLPSS